MQHETFTTAAAAIEHVASRASASSAVFVYDLAEELGFGTQTRLGAKEEGSAEVVPVQTRDGAGLSLVGRLSQGSSKDALQATAITAYTTPLGLMSMAQSFAYLPPATAGGRLVLQVAGVSTETGSMALIPSLATLASTISSFPEDFAVLLSSAPQESLALSRLSYQITQNHVVHIFDHWSSAREVGHELQVPAASQAQPALTIEDALAGAGYGFFDYAGDKLAQTVVVLLNGPLALLAKAYAERVESLGIVIVRVLRPWNEEALQQVLPTTATAVHVLDDVPSASTRGPLFADVLGTVLDAGAAAPRVKAHGIVPSRTLEFATNPASFLSFLGSLVPSPLARAPAFDTPATKKLLFVGAAGGALARVPRAIEDGFRANRAIRALQLGAYDAFAQIGGAAVDRVLLRPAQDAAADVPLQLAIPVAPGAPAEADFLAVLDQGLVKTHALLHSVKPGSAVLVVTSWAAAEFVATLPRETLEIVRARNLHLYALDLSAAAEGLVGDKEASAELQVILVHLAFLRLYLSTAATKELVVKAAHATRGPDAADLDLEKLNEHVWPALIEVVVDEEDIPEAESHAALKALSFNSIVPDLVAEEESAPAPQLSSWHRAAKGLLFRDACAPTSSAHGDPYTQDPALRPEVPDRTFLVTCAVNRRLTPLSYDRNVFHIEFDTAGTGLTYAIGEALGVHGWNDEQEVLDFCTWYGADPAALVTIPVPGEPGRLHTRTVFQALQQQVDLFGRPGKAFYSDLAVYATGKVDRYALLFIGSPEGASTFKKMSEKETVTFAEVLQRYPSARPPIEVLCQIVGDIKPRHYSIASAQAVVGDRVDLLVVTVDWTTPSGSPRYGQCTRYLAGMKPGAKVTVSIKPSVMKLPPDERQPLIMAGLGTGAAPFRAFLQYKAWLAAQGTPIGPVYYYFGSRHQSQEYLYGEEIEAFIMDGIITRAGLAFSRDGPRKVYIQQKMSEDAEALANMLADEQGVFYLCGPTWPVGDIYEAITGALGKFKGKEPAEAAAFLEDLKEEERYVLEVY